jgi:hypothetical protein
MVSPRASDPEVFSAVGIEHRINPANGASLGVENRVHLPHDALNFAALFN